jgi:putative two-component system response regulator
LEIKILIVEDEVDAREEISECLTARGFRCDVAENGEEGLAKILADSEINIVLADIRMPGRSGLEMIEAANAEMKNGRVVEYIVITGHGGVQEAISSLKEGVIDFILKPVNVESIVNVVHRAEQAILLKIAKQDYERELKSSVQAKTAEIRGLYADLEKAYEEALECLAVAAEYKDPETGNHISRIGEYAKYIAGELGWPEKRQKSLALAAPLHDGGKIGIPESILLKPGKLDADEIIIMKGHSEIGHRILSRSNHPVMKMAANIARSHHERWDGGGYPRELVGAEIPIEARITMLGDVYDALRSKRPYKEAFTHKVTVSIILDGDGRTDPSHFDPEVLEVFRLNSDEFERIFERLVG